MTWVEEPEIGFWEATFLPGDRRGAQDDAAATSAITRPVTQQYPGGEAGLAAALSRRASAQSRRAGPREVRGLHAVRDGVPGELHCNRSGRRAARLAGPRQVSGDVRARRTALHLLRHVRGGLPGRCDRADAHLRPDGETRERADFDKEKLLAIYDETKDNPKDPVRTARGRLGPASEFAELPTLGPATPVPATTARPRRRRRA